MKKLLFTLLLLSTLAVLKASPPCMTVQLVPKNSCILFGQDNTPIYYTNGTINISFGSTCSDDPYIQEALVWLNTSSCANPCNASGQTWVGTLNAYSLNGTLCSTTPVYMPINCCETQIYVYGACTSNTCNIYYCQTQTCRGCACGN